MAGPQAGDKSMAISKIVFPGVFFICVLTILTVGKKSRPTKLKNPITASPSRTTYEMMLFNSFRKKAKTTRAIIVINIIKLAIAVLSCAFEEVNITTTGYKYMLNVIPKRRPVKYLISLDGNRPPHLIVKTSRSNGINKRAAAIRIGIGGRFLPFLSTTR